MEHYKSDIEDHEYQIKRYQWFNLKPNQENVGSVSKSRRAVKAMTAGFICALMVAGKYSIYLRQTISNASHDRRYR